MQTCRDSWWESAQLNEPHAIAKYEERQMIPKRSFNKLPVPPMMCNLDVVRNMHMRHAEPKHAKKH